MDHKTEKKERKENIYFIRKERHKKRFLNERFLNSLSACFCLIAFKHAGSNSADKINKPLNKRLSAGLGGEANPITGRSVVKDVLRGERMR